MYAMGLDIGTSTLSAVVIEADTGLAVRTLTVPNTSGIPAESWASLQDPERIWEQAQTMTGRLLAEYPAVACIGLTGQMHGILYTDEKGRALSPLFTWQDGRGDLRATPDETYTQALSRETGCALATGYGSVTHYYNLRNGLVPPHTAWAMTIQDYVGARLTGRGEPLTHISDAHSFGALDWPELSRLISRTEKTESLGVTRGGIPVAVAIGDNQASFLGSAKGMDSILVNMGTGGQISLAAQHAVFAEGIEARPYIDGRVLLVGFSLCGGRAYALLENLFQDIASLAGVRGEPLYEQMNRLADLPLEDPLSISTSFCGTRQNPMLRGEIRGIGDGNFTPAHLVQGVLRGMVEELHHPFRDMRRQLPKTPSTLVGSGNGIRQNPALRQLFERAFGLPLRIPAHREEAAYGAALFAMVASGLCASTDDAQRVIRYQDAT